MASSSESSDSEELPPDLSALMEQLKTSAASFQQQFLRSEPKMKEVVAALQEVSAHMGATQSRAGVQKTIGALTAAIGGAFAAPLTGGVSLVATAALVGGVVAAVGADASKSSAECQDAEKVKKLGKELMKLVRPLKRKLLEIKSMCEQLDEDSAEAQADIVLKAIADLRNNLRQLKEQQKSSQSDTLIQAANCSWKVVRELAEMKKELGDFTGDQTA